MTVNKQMTYIAPKSTKWINGAVLPEAARAITARRGGYSAYLLWKKTRI